MSRNFIWLTLSAVIFSCSEPYDFGLQGSTLDIVDGVVSTEIGRSKITISRRFDRINTFRIFDLGVFVIDQDSAVYPFYFELSDTTYRPVNPDFAATIGSSYRLLAFRNGDLIYESEYDSVPPAGQIRADVRDTTYQRITAGNLIQNVDATAAIAKVSPQSGSTYGRLKFRIEYDDYFTLGRREIRYDDQFALFECEELDNCLGEFSIPVGLSTLNRWYFFADSVPECALARDTTQVTAFCFLPCCQFLENWPADFVVSMETMSPRSYRYWLEIDRLQSNDGLLFDTFPFPLEGNVSCVNSCEAEVVGHFRAVSEVSDMKQTSL